jgi:uncharacterized protein involved in exopolysaccharide biosynthesis
MEPTSRTLADYLDIFARRKLYVIVPFMVITVVALIIALKMPRTFRSTATLQIEAPTSAKFIATNMTDFADEQIQSIYQKVLTTDTVLVIIEEEGLYQDIKTRFTKQELAEVFRGNTQVKIVTSSLSPRSSSEMAEIAFTVAFSDASPVKARDIATRLANLFVEQSNQSRTQRAVKTTEFLQEESQKLDAHIQEVNAKIVTYKEKYNLSLPEQVEANRAAMDRTESELRDTDNQIRMTRERIIFLSAELAREQAQFPTLSAADKPQTKEDALRRLQAEYLKLASVYSPSHPTMVRLKREIKALDPLFDGGASEDEVRSELEQARRDLAAMEERYSGNHPDLASRRTHITILEQRLRELSRQPARTPAMPARTVNPAYINLEAQHRASQSELQALTQRKRELEDRFHDLQKLISLAPQVEAEYLDLTRERDNSVKKYNELKEKLFDAKLVQTMEEEQQGQTLRIIEQPELPLRPESANRRKVAFSGAFLALAAGVGCALLMEFLDPRIRGYRAIIAVSGLMPLVVIPYIESPAEMAEKLEREERIRKFIRLGVILLILGAIILGLIYLPDMMSEH